MYLISELLHNQVGIYISIFKLSIIHEIHDNVYT